MGFGGFTALSLAAAVPRRRSVDAVMAMSPPLTLGAAGRLIAWRRRAPFVFNVQDVFPDVAVELGVINGARTIAALERLERHTYQMADAVTVLSDDLRDNVTAKLAAGRGKDADVSKVEVIPNFVDVERIDAGGDGKSTARSSVWVIDWSSCMRATSVTPNHSTWSSPRRVDSTAETTWCSLSTATVSPAPG